MIMPFIRLISIYVIVIVAVVAIFKRDQIMEMTGLSFSGSETEEVAATEEVTPKPEAQATPVSAPAATETEVVAKTETAEAAEETAEIKQPTAPAPVAQAAASQSAPQTAMDATDTRTRLNEARQSYWNGDLAGAGALYAALAHDEPGNPDVNGELGNVLYAQRRYDEAAEAYFTTGKLLVETGNPAQVITLINVLQSIAPEKAASLYAMLAN